MDEARFSRWIKEWILDCPDQKAYLAKIGDTKLRYLKGKALPDAWISETEKETAKIDFQSTSPILRKGWWPSPEGSSPTSASPAVIRPSWRA